MKYAYYDDVLTKGDAERMLQDLTSRAEKTMEAFQDLHARISEATVLLAEWHNQERMYHKAAMDVIEAQRDIIEGRETNGDKEEGT